MHTSIKGLLLTILFCCTLLSPAVALERADYHLVRTNIVVTDLQQPYTLSVVRKATVKPGRTFSESISYGELETIVDLNATYQKGRKYVPVQNDDITDRSIISNNFYTGRRLKDIRYPTVEDAFDTELNYTIEGQQPMLLSGFQLTHLEPVDTFIYSIQLPEGVELLYQFEGDTTIANISVVKRNNSYTFEAYNCPGISELMKNDIPADDLPNVRMLLIPKEETDKPWDYFATWYYNLIAPKTTLTEELKKELTTQLGTNVTPEAVFNFVKERISYIDVENGLGAIQPRPVSDMYLNKQGDCKDMANLLCQSLRYMGYDAHVALSASLSHRFDLDFPSLRSANHAICVLQMDGEWLFLDATERYGDYGKPSMHTQGKHVLVIYPDKGERVFVKPVSAEINTLIVEQDLEVNGLLFEGTTSIQFNGMQQSTLRYAINYLSAGEFADRSKKLVYELVPAIEREKLLCQATDSNMYCNSAATTKKVITQIGSKKYISQSFLPFPHPLPDIVQIDGTHHTYMHTLNKYSIGLHFPKGVELLNAPEANFSKDGFTFQYQVEQTDNEHIVISYHCRIDHLSIGPDQIETLNELNHTITTTLAKAITYEDL